LIRDHRAEARHYLAAGVMTAIIGLAVELLQLAFGLDFEFLDVIRDVLGTAAFLALAWTLRHPMRRTLRLALRVCAVAVVAGVFIPPIHTAAAIANRWLAFPKIAGFESRLDARLCSDSENLRVRKDGSGNSVMVVVFRPKLYSGWAIDGPFPSWKGYRELRFTVRSEQPECLQLNVRIHDAAHNNEYHDRFNTVVQVWPGLNTFEILLEDVRMAPRGRDMDLNRIGAIGMFLVRPGRVFELCFEDFRLE
jgi:hypothetical protein